MVWTLMVIRDIAMESKLTIAEMGFVGNQWEVSAVPTDTIKDSIKKEILHIELKLMIVLIVKHTLKDGF